MRTDLLTCRHNGIQEADLPIMLEKIGVSSVDELIDKTIPTNIRLQEPLPLAAPMTERQFAEHIADLASQNKLYTSYIGMGWYDAICPAVIQRNVFENPAWYTSYTPYQAEVSQGRLEALLNFQTAVSDLTAMPLANCSLLDEATAAAEAANMMFALRSRDQQKKGANVLFVDENIFPQNLAVIRTRVIPQGMTILVGDYKTLEFAPEIFGCIIQYPNSNGSVEDYREFVEKAHAANCKVAVDADILSLAMLVPPGEWGADIVFGSTQRLGIPMFYGGPSAAYFATRDEFKRNMPGRIIGLSKDKYGKLCYRMALQTREQHIKREKATSNICTAQALLATMAGFYACYHGQDGIKTIAKRIHSIATYLNKALTKLGFVQKNELFFDTLYLELPEHVSQQKLRTIALSKEVNLRYFDNGMVGLSIDETTDIKKLNVLLSIFCIAAEEPIIEVTDVTEKDKVIGYTYYAITNHHVIEDGMTIKVYIGPQDLYIKASVIAKDKNKDLAIIKFDSYLHLIPLELGNSDNLKKGQFAIALGSPQGYEYYNSMTLGIISYPNRLIADEYGENLYIQVDVAINPGNSGGPLLNIYGEVIGVNTMKLVDEEIDLMGFSIPINIVKEFIKKNTK